ncbi:MAG: bifunctional oligoribonuclease/PAP phosphatase NrnA [Clostridia bacterium]
MNLNEFCKAFADGVENSGSIVILPHVSADGDALGSAIAMAYFLISKNKHARVVLEEPIPDKYNFLNNDSFIELYETERGCEADMIIALDTGDINRLGLRKTCFTSDNTWNIDHHKTNTEFARNNYVDTAASSTGEIVFRIMENMGYHICCRPAEALFTAISTDTGGLRYSNTTPESMRICASLLETGIDIAEISHRAFDMMPYPKVLLQGAAIDNMRLYFGGDLAVITLKSEDYDFLNGKEEYFDGIVNLTVNTEGVRAGVLIRETSDGTIKVNLRSAEDGIDVSSLAGNNSGGGHIRAAGFTDASRSLEQAKEYIMGYFAEIFGNNEH